MSTAASATILIPHGSRAGLGTPPLMIVVTDQYCSFRHE
jgi:hypothetical protein